MLSSLVKQLHCLLLPLGLLCCCLGAILWQTTGPKKCLPVLWAFDHRFTLKDSFGHYRQAWIRVRGMALASTAYKAWKMAWLPLAMSSARQLRQAVLRLMTTQILSTSCDDPEVINPWVNNLDPVASPEVCPLSLSLMAINRSVLTFRKVEFSLSEHMSSCPRRLYPSKSYPEINKPLLPTIYF